MKKIIIIGIILYSQNVKSQTDYVLTNHNDTIKVIVLEWNDTRVICDVNGKETKFKANKIIGFKAGETYTESARVCPTLIGFKKRMFLETIVTGKISLYSISVTDHFMHNKKVGATQIVNNREITSDVLYVKKTSVSKQKFKKLMGYGKIKKMTGDCEIYYNKYKNNSSSIIYPYQEQIEFYNQNCK